MKDYKQSLKYYSPSTIALDEMLEACTQAKHSIQVEEFVLIEDEVGEKFINVFEERAKAGIGVQLLLDGWGSKELLNSQRLKKMKKAGVKVAFYRPFKWWKPWEILPRDHRKIFIIDEESAFIGGVCLYDEVKYWHDMMVKVSLPLAAQFTYIFSQSWKQIEQLGEIEISSHPEFETNDSLSIYANSPETEDHDFTDKLLEKIDSSQQSIQLVSPYFTPSRKVIRALKKALNRGIDVKIFLSNKLDKAPPYYVAKQLSGTLINMGAKIYYYQPNVIHLKAMVIDDSWAAMGSCNLDGLSIHHNREAMLIGTEHSFVERILEEFSIVQNDSLRFSYEDWQARPISQIILGNLLKPLRNYL